MTKKKLVKIELTNPRFSKTEMRGHAAEFIHYSRYSGFVLVDFNDHLREAKLVPIKSDFNESCKIHIETYIENAKVLYQLTKLYPAFGNWKIKALAPGVDITNFAHKEAKPEKAKKTSKPKTAKKAVAPKKSEKKKPVAIPKKAVKKKPVSSPKKTPKKPVGKKKK